ncbi:BAG family molecular chaperone regulator 8, chloroplastic [Lycium ferocissimum]|uniref:BAG family molecular chaperone regulator 8, chloroplastic n=1 Tax=Lycium ferocissimum TaxID=112874 RepID=UPI002814BBEB|nr:BAG family molecular chaperone regulator 8, chloroplastic [Lycium ferocissimum]
MASHHHYHHPCPTAASTTICYCYSCHPTPTPTPYPQHPHPPPPNPHSTPPYTHYPATPPHTPHFYASHPTPPPPPYNPHTPCQCEPTHHFQESNHHYFQESNKLPDQQTDRIVTSLLRRIAALESTLSVRRSSSSSSSRQSLRDAAARTIQAHFRAFLARRSRTLRQLKQLASIKTTLNILKSSVSAKTPFHTHTVSRRAMDLLVKLDSIQGDDQLIRDGKRSISNELTRFLKVINGVTVISRRIVKKVRNGNKARVFSSDAGMELGTNSNEAIDKFVDESEEEDEEGEHQKPRMSEVGKSGVLRNRDEGRLKPKQKKSVSFAENVNGQESYDAELELMKNLSKRVEKIGILSKDGAEVDEEEDGGGSSGSSDNEIMDPDYISRKDNGYYERRNVRDENENANENETESFLFSAPLPVKMEGRAADYVNRKKGVKIVEN